MMSGNLQEYSAGRHIGLHMVWIQLNSSGRKNTHLLFIVVDGQVSIIGLIAPKPVPHSVGCGGGGAGAGVGECGFEIALIYASRILPLGIVREQV